MPRCTIAGWHVVKTHPLRDKGDLKGKNRINFSKEQDYQNSKEFEEVQLYLLALMDFQKWASNSVNGFLKVAE